MPGISTHVLDTATGLPAAGVGVRLERLAEDTDEVVVRPDPGEKPHAPDPAGAGEVVRVAATDDDGRVAELLPPGERLRPGEYRLTFDVGDYFAARGVDAFYPHASIVFRVTEPDRHHHVPLLVSPFGYTTYRGT